MGAGRPPARDRHLRLAGVVDRLEALYADLLGSAPPGRARRGCVSPKVQDLGRLRSAGGRARRARRPPRTAHGAGRRGARRRVALRHLRASFAALRRAGDAPPLDPGELALTFDDGPDPRHTPRSPSCSPSAATAPRSSCSAALSASTPRRPRRSPPAGHELASHGDDHRLLALAPPAEVQAQLRAAEDAVRQATGEPPAPLFRPPHGVRSPWLARVAGAAGYRVCAWDGSVFDTALPGVETIVERVKPLLRPGAVILLHDGDGSGQRRLARADGRSAAGDPGRGRAPRAPLGAAQHAARLAAVQTRFRRRRLALQLMEPPRPDATEDAAIARILVVLDSSPATAALVDAVRLRAARGPVRFHLLVQHPGNSHRAEAESLLATTCAGHWRRRGFGVDPAPPDGRDRGDGRTRPLRRADRGGGAAPGRALAAHRPVPPPRAARAPGPPPWSGRRRSSRRPRHRNPRGGRPQPPRRDGRAT